MATAISSTLSLTCLSTLRPPRASLSLRTRLSGGGGGARTPPSWLQSPTPSDSDNNSDAGTKSTRKKRKTKQKRGENQPKRPMSAYMLFLNENRAAIKAKLLEDNEKVSVGEIAKVGGLRKALEDTAKDVFIEKSITLKEEYAAATKTWRTEHPEEAEAPQGEEGEEG